MRKILRTVSIGSLVVGAAIGATLPAAAAPYDGTNPAAGPSYCANGSKAIWSGTIYDNMYGIALGTMEVRYSPSCGTNWVRVNNTWGGAGSEATKTIKRLSDTYEVVDTDGGLGWSYSMQIYAPGATCIYASALITDAGNHYGRTAVNLC